LIEADFAFPARNQLHAAFERRPVDDPAFIARRYRVVDQFSKECRSVAPGVA
jgi:hypothetical protein